MSGTKSRWRIALAAALGALVVGAAAVAVASLLTGSDEQADNPRRAAELTVATSGVVTEVGGLLRELDSASGALEGARQQQIVAELGKQSRKAAVLARKAHGELGSGSSVRASLEGVNRRVTQAVAGVRRAAQASRRPNGRQTAIVEVQHALDRIATARSQVTEIAQVLHTGVGPRAAKAVGVVLARLPRATVDLPLGANVVLRGSESGELAGASLAGVGDVNGDGRDDIAVGVPGRGSVDIVYGGQLSRTLDLDSLGSGGFVIASLPEATPSSASSDLIEGIDSIAVARAGDVNGDGLDDVLIGAPTASIDGNESSGAAYVIYGKADSTAVDVDNLEGQGFRIAGPGPYWRVGEAVAGVGDTNGDGRADFAVGGRMHTGADPATAYEGPAVAWLTTGGAGHGDFSLPLSGGLPGTMRINGIGSSLAAAGDVNGDGLADVIGGDAYNRMGAPGSVAVVFGTRTPRRRLSVRRPGTWGLTLQMPRGRIMGSWVAGVGDQNGDGLADVGVGSLSNSGAAQAPRVDIVYGRRSPQTVSLRHLGGAGTALRGVGPALAGTGDINADHLDDLLVAFPSRTTTPGEAQDIAAVAVLGRKKPVVHLSSAHLDAFGFRVDALGVAESPDSVNHGRVGDTLTGIGDVDGDGLDDFAVGASTADRPDLPGGVTRAGAVYVILAHPPADPRGELRGRLSETGLGGVKIGAPLDGVERLLGIAADVLHPSGQEECETAPTLDRRVSMLATRGAVARITVTGPGYETDRGIQVGDTQASVLAAYGNLVRRTPHEYYPNGSYLTYTPTHPAVPGGRIVFETKGQRVVAIHAGRLPEVSYVEGCA